uniref:Uncharacterized protein n=1 Tax=uncultured marine virus TaxID=186617 RepID=A0A0F7L9B5_9VIRU|nr:phage conserved hypothetical protein TIGR01671 [uncultured marine virus]
MSYSPILIMKLPKPFPDIISPSYISFPFLSFSPVYCISSISSSFSPHPVEQYGLHGGFTSSEYCSQDSGSAQARTSLMSKGSLIFFWNFCQALNLISLMYIY